MIHQIFKSKSGAPVFGIFIFSFFILLFGCASGGGGDTAGDGGSSGIDTAKSGFMLKAGDIVWEQTSGPEGGVYSHLELDPDNPLVLITGNSDAIYRSEDGGGSWEKVLDTDMYVGDIEFSSAAPGLVYCTTAFTDVYRSRNSGKDWELISPEEEFRFVGQIEIDPNNPRVLYLASAYPGRIYKSSDAGDSWKEISRFSESGLVAMAILGEGTILAGVGGNLTGEPGRFMVSTNDGKTWQERRIGQPDTSHVRSIIVHPERPEIVYLGFADSYNRRIQEQSGDFSFTSRDGGSTWTALPDNTLHDSMLHYLSCGGPEGRMVYAAIGGSLQRSVDGGRTWELLLGKDPFDIMSMQLGVGDYVDLAINPEDPNIIYLPSGGAGIAKSVDGGRNWELINDGLIGMLVANIAMHPKDPLTLYASGLPLGIPGTFKTIDGGKHWEKLDGGGIYHPFTDDLYINPADPNKVYNIADIGTLFESLDGGETWRALFDSQFGMETPAMPKTAFQFSSIYALEVAKDNPDIIYVVKNGFGVYKSTNGGDTWNYQVYSPDYSYSLAIDPDDPHRIYSGYQRKVFEEEASLYRNRPGEEEWDKLLTLEGIKGVRWVEIDPSNPRRIYAGTVGETGTIYVSRDGGRNWEKLNEHLTFTTIWGHSQLQVHPQDPETLYAGTWGGGTYRSRTGGESWEKLDEAHTFSPTSIQICREDPSILYACDRTAPLIHRSDDGGDTWRVYYDFRDDFGEEQFMSSAVAVLPGNPDTIIAASFRYPVAMAGAVAKIGPQGLMEDLSESFQRSVLEIEIDESAPDSIYVTTHVHGVYKSENGGALWERLDDRGTGLPRTGYYDVDIHPEDSSVLFASSLSGVLPDYMVNPPGVKEHLAHGGEITNIDPDAASGIYKSTDSGGTWRQVLKTESEAKGVEIDRENPHRVFAADMEGGVWVSTDSGENWRQENDGLASRSMTSVKVRGKRIYASTQGSGVYAGVISTDGSIRWLPKRSNKPKATVSTIQIEVDPADPSRIFASAYPGGMLRSDDGGKTWNDKNFLTPSIRVEDPTIQGYYSFDINPKDPKTIWMGVYGKGMFVSRDGMEYNMKADGADRTMAGKHITRVLINPARTEEVWVSSEEGTFRTQDDGATWEPVNRGLHTKDVYVMSITNNGTLFAGTRGYGVYRFHRGREEWEQLKSVGNFGVFWSAWDRPLYQYSDMLIDPEDPDIWYLASFPTGLYKSSDGGRSFRESNVGFIEDGADGIFTITFHPHDTKTIFAGTYNGVSVTRDGGAHWERISEGMHPEQWPYSVAVDPYDPNIMYAATKNGKDKGFVDRHEPPYDFAGKVYKTTNGGKTWFESMKGMEDDNEFFNLIIHPKNRHILFVNTMHDGVFMSTDAGKNWTMVNKGLTNHRSGNANNVSNSLGLSPDGRYLYLGTMGTGVWRAKLY